MSFTTVPGQASGQSASTTPSQSSQEARQRVISLLSTPSTGGAPEAPPEVAHAAAAANVSEVQSPPGVPESDPTSAAATPPEKALSPQYAALARKEKAIRGQVQELKTREAQFVAREAAVAAKEASIAKALEFETRLEKDPMGVLAEKGFTYDKLTQSAMSLPSEQDVMVSGLKAEIEALRQEMGKTKQSFEDNQTNAYKQAVTQIRSDVTQLVATNPEFETIHATKSVGDVVELIEATFKNEGVLLSVEEAAREVEEYLVEEASKLYKLKKFQQKFAPKVAETTVAAAATPQQPNTAQKPPMKTLTNSVGAQRPLTQRERAMAAFHGTLKK